MDITGRSGRQAVAALLDSRQITLRLVRLAGVVALSQLVAQWLINTTVAADGIAPPIALESAVHVGLAVVCVITFSWQTFRRDLLRTRDVVAAHELEFEQRDQTQRFFRDVTDGFEMAEHDSDLYTLTEAALAQASPARTEILVADASNAHLARVAISSGRPAPGCGVVTPSSCPAVRRGRTMVFDDPNALSACPRLRERNLPSTTRATCIPVNVLGAPNAVLHTLWPAGTFDAAAADAIDTTRLEGVAVRFGSRLGMLRATQRSRVQADTDPLTGLLNRRAFENRVRDLMADGGTFSLAMLDLDHFKHLNDMYGHDTGDRALRLFARAMRSALRDADIIARFGGEEFVVVLPNADIAAAAPAMHRIREQLSAHLSAAEVPSFTCSIGLIDSTHSTDLSELARLADRALMTAKAQGRDRIVIADEDPLLDAAPTTVSR